MVRNVLTAMEDETGPADRKNYTHVEAGSREQNDQSRTENTFGVYFDLIYAQD